LAPLVDSGDSPFNRKGLQRLALRVAAATLVEWAVMLDPRDPPVAASPEAAVGDVVPPHRSSAGERSAPPGILPLDPTTLTESRYGVSSSQANPSGLSGWTVSGSSRDTGDRRLR